eukprot:scaffold1466_cov249-Pinguiococcus_pyrenoidosus.AAC.5
MRGMAIDFAGPHCLSCSLLCRRKMRRMRTLWTFGTGGVLPCEDRAGDPGFCLRAVLVNPDGRT